MIIIFQIPGIRVHVTFRVYIRFCWGWVGKLGSEGCIVRLAMAAMGRFCFQGPPT